MPARSSGNASITYNGNASTGLLTVTINSTGDMLEATEIGDQRKSFIAGQASTTASGSAGAGGRRSQPAALTWSRTYCL